MHILIDFGVLTRIGTLADFKELKQIGILLEFGELTQMGILTVKVMLKSISEEIVGIVPKVADPSMVAGTGQLAVE